MERDARSDRRWVAVIVEAAPELAEAVAAFLLDRGAPGLVEEDAGAVLRIAAHFREPPPPAEIERFLASLPAYFPGAPLPSVRQEPVQEADWRNAWKEHFAPVAVGRRLYVHPPWVTEVPAQRLAIAIDPGMAFGTGQHATTRGCLEMLEELAGTRPLGRVLDLGTGSGVLAIAAARLGARAVEAVDIDSEAVAAARANVAANGVAGVVSVRARVPADPGSFDVVVANIVLRELLHLGPAIRGALAPGGEVIASGLSPADTEVLAAGWAALGLRLREARTMDGWTTARFDLAGGEAAR